MPIPILKVWSHWEDGKTCAIYICYFHFRETDLYFPQHYHSLCTTRAFLSSTNFFVNSILKSIGLTLNNESKPLKSIYLMSNASTYIN